VATITEIRSPRPFRPGGVVAIGWYDGVHRGHREALAHLRRVADERGVSAGIVVLDDDRPDRQLTSIDQRLDLLGELDAVDTIWVVRASVDEWSASTGAFVREVLLHATGAGAVATMVGPSQGHMVEAFGQRLVELAAAGEVALVPLDEARREWDEIDATTSSAEVARLLDAGDVRGAAVLLGRPHEMRGVVEHGDQRGRTLGFPTANVPMPVSFVIPAEGVYAGTLTADDGITHAAAISLGRRPTFYPDGLALLEAHVLDYGGDLYGRPVRIGFLEHLRGQRRFDGPEDLVAQLRADVEATRAVVAPLIAR